MDEHDSGAEKQPHSGLVRTYSLAEVAAQVLPAEWKHPVQWLQRRLRRGEITGYKVGHDWRMTEADVDALLARYRNAAPVVSEAPAPRQLSFTASSRRRLRN